MIPEGPLFHKPKSFVTAKNLLYASIFLGILNGALSYYTFGFTTNGGIKGAAINVFTLAAIFILARLMAFYKKWARTTFLILFLIGMIAYPFALIQLFRTDIMLAALSVVQNVLQLMALVFLYSKECNNWFNSSTTEMLP